MNIARFLLAASFVLTACSSAAREDEDRSSSVAAETASNAPEAPAIPAASAAPDANAAPAPIRLYTASGTSEDPVEGFNATVGQGIDPKLYQWVPIDYPAALFPMEKSVDEGVALIVDQINTNPGKFALVGYSQGAIVISRVYDELRTGSLQSRRGDLVTGVTFGNPMRQAGHTFPGGHDPGGHGIESDRLTNTEDLWWDICNPDEIACAITDDLGGQDFTAVFGVIMQSYNGQDDIGALLKVSITHPLEQLSALVEDGNELIGWATKTLPFGHGEYATLAPIPGDPRTGVEIAIDHLNDAANTVDVMP